MIEFSDITLRETKGDYGEICKLMPSNDWMLRSDVFVSTPIMVTTFIVHFWHDRKVVIYDLNRAVRIDLPDEDVKNLSEWCVVYGWKNLHINDRLIVDKIGFDCWQRSYRSGLIYNKQFEDYEEEENARLTKTYKKELEEENDAT